MTYPLRVLADMARRLAVTAAAIAFGVPVVAALTVAQRVVGTP